MLDDEKKYKLLLDDTITIGNTILCRIKALKNFGCVKKGQLGGYIEKEDNLSHQGNCWIYDNAKVFENAEVYGNAEVRGSAVVYGNAEVRGSAVVYGNAVVRGSAVVRGNAVVYGNAVVSSMADYMVFKNHWSSGRFFTWTKSNNMWSVGCFYGTGEELIKKAYQDSEKSGKFYEKYVNFVKELLELEVENE